MFFIKYGLFALALVTWFVGSSSVDLDLQEMAGDREKRTIILGVLFKKLLLQQSLAINNNMRMNSTIAIPSQEMAIGDSGSSNGNTLQESSEQPSSPSPPSLPTPPASPAPPAPPAAPALPQPDQSTPSPESTPQVSQPTLSMPQGIRTPQVIPQGPPSSQRFPQQQLNPGFQSFNSFSPSQQPLLFPANYPFGVQRFSQLPFGPAPQLGAQAGPQRFSNYFPFNFPQNGYFQNIPQLASMLPPTGTSGFSPQSPSQTGSEFASPQQTPSDIGPSQQIPPSEIGSIEQAPSSSSGPPSPEAPSRETQTNPSSQESDPGPQQLQNPSAPGGDIAQELPPVGPSPTSAPEPGEVGSQQNIPIGPGPPSQLTRGEGSLPNFSSDPQQETSPSNDQETSPLQQGPPSNISPQSFDNNSQQPLSSNGLPTEPNSIPQNFASPNGPQRGQPEDNFFDLRQFVGADNSVFDFPQGGGTPSNGNPEQQQQTQSDSFQNGLFAPISGQEQFSSVNDPRSNFAFRGQQLDFSSPFQGSGNFQRDFFQQSLF